MPRLPVVAIIGRPNTGKSTLFNTLIKERKSIESTIPGTTRDHISSRVMFGSLPALLVDTGGIGASRDTDFEENVRQQSLLALEFADIILLTINSREELTQDDGEILKELRKRKKKDVAVITVLTKADTPGEDEATISNFAEVDIGDTMIAISAPHKRGLASLREEVEHALRSRHFQSAENQDSAEHIPRIAIIGRPNVGKSSIVNALMSPEKRKHSPLVVSDIAGTTRDAVDTVVTYHGKPYVLVDTAGLKKHRLSLDQLERFSMMRTITAIEMSDIVVLVLDASTGVSRQDKKIASLALQHGKGLLLLLNKIDMVRGEHRESVVEAVKTELSFCTRFVSVIPCSSKTREGLLKIFDSVESIESSRVARIPAKELRRWFEDVTYGQPLGAVGRTKHITQARDVPPTFVLFVNNPQRVKVSQLRYLENRLRESFAFHGTPIRWITKSSKKD